MDTRGEKVHGERSDETAESVVVGGKTDLSAIGFGVRCYFEEHVPRASVAA